MQEIIILDETQVEKILDMEGTLKCVERAFLLQAKGEAIMPPKLYLELPQFNGDFRAMPTYIDGMAGVKWVSVYPGNVDKKIRTVVATILLTDCHTGYPIAMMDGTYITNMRTGASGGIAVKYLARKDSSIIGVVGAGAQAKTQLMAIKLVMPKIDIIKVYDINADAGAKFAAEMSKMLNLNIVTVDSIQKAVDADVVVTTTPSRKPVIMAKWIKPGTHINAIGADAQGKQELESSIMTKAKIVIDDYAQASHSGEINVPLSEGVIKQTNIHGTLGQVVAGMKKGRENDKEITIFDSTGLAIQDIACAKIVYEKAKGNGKVISIKIK
jgi:alanine dehydrogenase